MLKRLLLSIASSLAIAGSAYGDTTPRLIDTIGIFETEVGLDISSSGKPAWTPTYNFILEFDGYENDDVVLVQLKQGAKAIGKPAPCKARTFVKTIQARTEAPVLPVNLAYFDCDHPKEGAIAKAGTYSLELTYKQTLADKKHALGSLQFTVLEIKQGSQNKPFSTWTLSHDQRMPIATVEEHVNASVARDPKDGLERAAFMHHEADRKAKQGGSTYYTFEFWTKAKDKPLNDVTMSCLLDGKKVAEPRYTGSDNLEHWTFTGKKGQEKTIWQRHQFQASQTYVWQEPDKAGKMFVFAANPGEYRCVATSGGEMVKELFFTIGKDGTFVDSPCQAQLNTLRHVHVVRTKDGAVATAKVDAKAGTRGFFGRVAWGAGCPASK